MTAVAYLYAPHLSADIVQQEDPSAAGRPLAILAAPQESALADCSWEAAARGLYPGMPLRQARLACPDLAVRVCPPACRQQHLEPVWEALARAGCLVEPDPSGGAFLGLPRGLDPSAVASIVQGALGAVWVLGVGPTRLVARAAALEQAERLHRRPPHPGAGSAGVAIRSVPPDQARPFLEGLPLRHFWVCPDPIREQLGRLGFKTVGALAALSREALVDRFGPIGWQLWQKSRGIDSGVVLAAYPPPSLSRRMDLDGEGIPWEQGEAIAAEVRRWARDLHARLEARMQTAQALGMRLWMQPPEVVLSETIRLGEGRQGAGAWETLAVHLLRRIGQQASAWQRGGARPLRLELVASPVVPAPSHQASLIPRLGAASRQSRLHRALQVVADRVGPGLVYRASQRPWSRREAMLALVEQGAWLP